MGHPVYNMEYCLEEPVENLEVSVLVVLLSCVVTTVLNDIGEELENNFVLIVVGIVLVV